MRFGLKRRRSRLKWNSWLMISWKFNLLLAQRSIGWDRFYMTWVYELSCLENWIFRFSWIWLLRSTKASGSSFDSRHLTFFAIPSLCRFSFFISFSGMMKSPQPSSVKSSNLCLLQASCWSSTESSDVLFLPIPLPDRTQSSQVSLSLS